MCSHGRGRWFEPSRAHQSNQSLSESNRPEPRHPSTRFPNDYSSQRCHTRSRTSGVWRWPIAVLAVSRSPWLALALHIPVKRPAGQPAAVSIRSGRIGHSSGSYGYHFVRRLPAPHPSGACATKCSRHFVRSSPAPERLRKIRLERIFASAPQGRGAGRHRAIPPASMMPVTDAG